MNKSRYHALKALGRCVICGKNKADEGYATCLVCRMDARGKETHLDSSRARHREWLKRRRDLLYAFRVCVTCGKRDAKKGSHQCDWCIAKARERSARTRQAKGIIPRMIMLDGYHCAVCGSCDLVAGKKVCSNCYSRLKLQMEHARIYSPKKNYFTMQNELYWHEENKRRKGNEVGK